MAASAPNLPQHNSHSHAHDCCGHDHHGHHHHHDENAGFWARNEEILLSLGAGALLLLGFLGERFLGLPHYFAVILYGGAMFAGGFKLALHTVPTLLRGRFDIEFLMLAGAIGAAILNQWAEGAFLLFLFSLGHALEHHAMHRARSAISALGTLAPKTATVRRDGQEMEVAVGEIQIGDLALVRPGDRVGVDGIVASGHSALDQSSLTGESVPVEKTVGDEVFAGTLNGDGALEIEVTKLARDSTLSRVIQLVEEAQSQKASSQIFSEKFERIFVPCILGVVILAALLPPLLELLTWREAFYRAIAGMVAASPCALALATPSAILAAISAGARGGVLFKGGVHLETLGQVRAIAFDKTGTLTAGKPEVAQILAPEGETEILRLAAALGHDSSHPLSLATLRRAGDLVLPEAHDLQTLRGRGVVAQIEGQTVRLGNAAMMSEAGIAIPELVAQNVQKWGEAGMPSAILARENQILGALAFADEVRPGARNALEKLRAMGISQMVMLTGDNARVAQNVAPLVGATEFRADLLPEDKVTAIRELQHKWGKVAMIGDGVNDAPALAHATVGVAMGATGSGIALETADVALLADDLERLPFAVGLSRAARAIVAQNLLLSLGVIALLVPATLFGAAPLSIAVLFHEGSTVVVCLNALRLLGYRP